MGKLSIFASLVAMATLVGAGGVAGIDPLPYATPVHFRPSKRAVGDVMPFYFKGEYHVFFLLNATGNHDINWEHAVSTDLVHLKELEPALRWDPNDPTGPDGGTMFTGCVIEKGDLFHAFYTGWNPKNRKGREFVLHATSKDLIKWTKHPQDIIAPDGIHYANHRQRDFRDPDVFWSEREKQYWMLLFANDAETKNNVVGVLTSKDLEQWRQVEPLEGVRGQECPDLFTIGDTHYLLGATYTFSKNLRGPYRKPPVSDVIDRPVIYAGKWTFDGRRHIWVGGWLKGPMSLPRAVYAGPEGQLYCKPVEEVVAAFNDTALELGAQPELSSGCRVDIQVPGNYMLDCRFRLDAKSKFTIGMRRQQGNNEGYQLVLEPALKRLRLAGASFDYKRPCPVDTSKPVKVQAFVIGTTIECFVNDQYPQTCLARKYDKGRLSFNVEGGGAELLSVSVKTAR